MLGGVVRQLKNMPVAQDPEGWGALSISAPFCYTLTLHTDKAAALIHRVAPEEPFSEALLPGSTNLGNL